MEAKAAILLAVSLAALAAASYRALPMLRPMLSAGPDWRWDRPLERVKGVAVAVGLHRRLLRIPYSGALHLMIFTSFIVLFTAIIQAFGGGFAPGFSLAPIGGNSWIALLQDVFAIVILIGLGLAAYQRFVLKPARFKGSNNRDATFIYLLVLSVVISMVMEFACRAAAGGDPSAGWRFLSGAIGTGLQTAGLSGDAALGAAEAFYSLHVASILGFLVYIPGSKHRHMFTAVPNIFFRNLKPYGVLAPPPAAEEDAKAPALSWKHLLDLYSCTECGRCQAACPAYAAGLPLSPKTLVMNLRDGVASVAGTAAPLAGGVISKDTLFACTTCAACMEVCPLHIEHVPKIVGLRRPLVEAGEVEPMLQDALTNVLEHGNSMGKPPRQRAKWTAGLGFKIKDARKEPVDILWFVGDYASYDPRVQRLSKKLAQLLHAAGVDFGILYDAESNSGNDVRRAGEEGLFQMLAEQNIATLRKCTFNRIMTTDPHSLNALRHEYRALGAAFEVIHYTNLLLELLETGRIEAGAGQGQTVTYHDPCYLGRYSREFDAPREIIRRLGHTLHEMPRCRENSFCCGAGGGRIWSDDTGIVERPSENRIKEALALGDAACFVVACPKDNVMYTAAVQALSADKQIAVRDIVELFDTPTASEAKA